MLRLKKSHAVMAWIFNVAGILALGIIFLANRSDSAFLFVDRPVWLHVSYACLAVILVRGLAYLAWFSVTRFRSVWPAWCWIAALVAAGCLLISLDSNVVRPWPVYLAFIGSFLVSLCFMAGVLELGANDPARPYNRDVGHHAVWIKVSVVVLLFLQAMLAFYVALYFRAEDTLLLAVIFGPGIASLSFLSSIFGAPLAVIIGMRFGFDRLADAVEAISQVAFIRHRSAALMFTAFLGCAMVAFLGLAVLGIMITSDMPFREIVDVALPTLIVWLVLGGLMMWVIVHLTNRHDAD